MNDPLTILTIAPASGIAALRPVEWALQQGHHVVFIDQQRPALTRPYPTLRYAPLPRGERVAQSALGAERGTAAFIWANALWMRLLAARFRPDVTHVHGFGSNAMAAARAGMKPLIVSAWGSLNALLFPELATERQGKRARYILQRTDLLLVEPLALIPQIAPFVAPAPRVEQLVLGVEADRFHPTVPEAADWRRKLQIPEGAKVVLSGRGWAPIYQHHLILEAFARARPRVGSDTVLVFLGMGRTGYQSRAQYYQEARAQATRLGVMDAVRWVPVVPFEQMPAIYGMADLVVNYPSQDAFPSTLLEAAACECPIVTSWLPSYKGTFIEDYCTLVAPGEPDVLAEALVEALNTPHAAQAARLQGAREVVISQYAEARARERLMELYRELASDL